jgi:nucleoside-diphosphate-sugar epimerase
MNANVIFAAIDLGIEDIVFASSIQAMLPSIGNSPPPFRIPYLPIDGAAPANPGTNGYALSKVFCERLLEEAARAEPELAATALRFPMLVGGELLARLRSRPKVSPRWLNLGEALAYLYLEEAAELVGLALEQRRPGYRQYLPASSQQPVGLSLPDLIDRYYANVPLHQPKERMTSLVNVAALERDFGWTPREPLQFQLDES